ncbi:MAG: sigma-70 family RNA polymerase sigma factor [Firmicutes bacterium]|nr:sigma-70 family RNA polymerase sigma factor [Bacillota bacterium]
MTDDELYAQSRRKDTEAQALLYDRFAARVAAIARTVCRDREMVAEVVQDVFVRVWTTEAFDASRGAFDHWICVVAKRIAIDHLRRARSAPPLALMEHLQEDASADGARAFSSRMLRADLERAMLALRAEEREIIELAYFHGHTLTQVAEQLQLPVGTVKTRLHAALRRMRTTMADWQMEVGG